MGAEAGSDSELMMRVRDGRIDELGVLFERHHARLLAFCLRMTGDRPSAEDLVQEVFVRMMRYRESYRGDSFLQWMFTLARNACTDHLRKAAHRQHPSLGDREPVADEPPVSERVERRESLALLGRALALLSEEKREVLALRRAEVKFEEIARICGCPVSTVKVRAHRALRELREIYEGLASGATA